jgi:hypothetical protein
VSAAHVVGGSTGSSARAGAPAAARVRCCTRARASPARGAGRDGGGVWLCAAGGGTRRGHATRALLLRVYHHRHARVLLVPAAPAAPALRSRRLGPSPAWR